MSPRRERAGARTHDGAPLPAADRALAAEAARIDALDALAVALVGFSNRAVVALAEGRLDVARVAVRELLRRGWDEHGRRLSSRALRARLAAERAALDR